MNYTRYKCPVCSEEMTRDVSAFLDHTDQHTFDVVRSKHPEWIARDGSCTRCGEYYEEQLAPETEGVMAKVSDDFGQEELERFLWNRGRCHGSN